MPACAGMTVLALIDFMFYSVAFVLLPHEIVNGTVVAFYA